MVQTDERRASDLKARTQSERQRPRRVLQVLTSVCAGGLSRYVLDLVGNLDAERFETHLVCTHFEGPHFVEAQGLVRSATVFTSRSQVQKLYRLWRLMRHLRPDVVHSHQEPIALISAALAGVPVRLETIHLARYWLQDGHPAVQAASRRCANGHLVYTEAERHVVARHACAGVQVITPGVDLSRMVNYWNKRTLPIPDHLPDRSFVVGTVARLDPQKGLVHLVDAFPPILQGCPEAYLLIVGDGPLRAELEGRCFQLGIAGRVLFTGYQIDAHRCLGAMDLFVMPSLFESWGFTAAEAMAAGVPVICTDIPGPSSFVSHQRTGLIVPPADPGAIATAVLQLQSDPARRWALGEAGKAYAREQLSLSGMIEACEQLYARSS
jgi:glycosyltransferase involved in cell wall biosynthesis